MREGGSRSWRKREKYSTSRKTPGWLIEDKRRNERHCRLLHRWDRVRVRVERDRDARVTEAFRDDLRMNAGGERKRRVRMLEERWRLSELLRQPLRGFHQRPDVVGIFTAFQFGVNSRL